MNAAVRSGRETDGQADVELQLAILAKNPAAQARFVFRFESLFRAIVRRALRKRNADWGQQCEDLLQEAFYDLLKQDAKAVAAWDPAKGRTFKNFLGVYVALRTSERLRKRSSPHRQPPLAEDDILKYLTDHADLRRQLEDRSLVALVKKYVCEHFGERDVRIFEMTHLSDCSAEDIAARLDVTIDVVFTVRHRIRKSLIAIRDNILLGELPDGEEAE